MSDLNSAFDSEKSLAEDFDKEGVQQPPPVVDHRTLLQRYGGLLNRGSPTGGLIGGTLGSGFGLPGRVVGTFLGDLAGQAPLSDAEQGANPQPLARKSSPTPFPEGYSAARSAQGGQPDYQHRSFKPDFAAAATDAATQGGLGVALKGLGYGATKFGFPRLGAALGGTTPREAVLQTTPDSVKGISTGSLQAVDAATLAGNPAAKEIAAIAAEQARRDANLAIERQLAEKNISPVQQRMAGRVPGLAGKTKDFYDEILSNVPADKVDKAFADTPSVAEAASNVPVMQARQQMIQAAMPQGADAKALKLATRPMAAAQARGVGSDPRQYAADAAGLRELGGVATPDNAYLSRVLNRVPGVGTAAQLLPQGGMSADRMAQATAAVLSSRGKGTINPLLEKLVSDNPAYRYIPLPQVIEDLLRRYGAQAPTAQPAAEPPAVASRGTP